MMKNIVKKLFISALIASVASMAAASATVVINVGDRSSHGILNLDKLIIKASTASNAPNAVVLSSGSKVGTTQICNTGLTLCKNVTDLWTGTDTHYTGKIVAGSSNATSNSTSNVSDPYINYVENGSFRSGIQLKAGEHTTIKANGGIITISSSGGTNGNHYTGYNRVTNATNGVTNNSSTNNNTYLNHVENNTVTSSNQIKGTGSVTVSANNGTIFISGTDNDTTYSQATSSTLGLVKLGSDTQQNTTANSVSSTASRTYAIQKNSNGQLVVNVPRTDNNTTYSEATSSTLGLVKLGSDTQQNTTANSVSSTASRTYAIQKNSNRQLVVNVPRTDNNTHYTGKIVAGSVNATSNSTSNVSDPYINYVENGSFRSGIQLKAGNGTSIKANNGVITISAFDLEAMGLGSYWKLNGSTLSTSGGNYGVDLASNLTVTGTTKIRGNLNFAWLNDSNGYTNTITTDKGNLNISTEVNITGGLYVKSADISVTKSNGKIKVNQICDQNNSNCKLVSELSTGGSSYWKLNGSTLSTSGGNYGVNLASSLTVTGTTKIRGNLNFAWLNDSNGYTNTITTDKGNLNISTEVNITGGLYVKSADISVTKSNGKIKVNQICDQNNSNCKLVSELSTGGGSSYWNLNTLTSTLSTSGGNYKVNLANNLTVTGTTRLNSANGSRYLQLDNNGFTLSGTKNFVGGNVNITGTTNINGQLNVYQRSQFTNGLSVQGSTTLQSTTVNGNFTAKDGNITLSGGTLSIKGNGNIYTNYVHLSGGRDVDAYLDVKNTRKNISSTYSNNAARDRVISSIRLIPEDRGNGNKSTHSIYKDGLDTYNNIGKYMPCSAGNEGSIVYYREYNGQYRTFGKFRGCVCTWNYHSTSSNTPDMYKCGWVDLHDEAFTEYASTGSNGNGWSNW